MKTALFTACLFLVCAATTTAQEYVTSKSYPHTADQVLQAATRAFAILNAKIEATDTAQHVLRVRFDRNRTGVGGANSIADYGIFTVTADTANVGYTLAELRLGHAPLSSMPTMLDSLSHSPIPGAKFFNVRDKSTADSFFRHLRKELGP